MKTELLLKQMSGALVMALACSVCPWAHCQTLEKPTMIEPVVRIAGCDILLSFEGEDLREDTQRLIADDLAVVLQSVDEVSFSALTEKEHSVYEREHGLSVTHKLDLGCHRKFLPDVLRTRLGPAVQIGQAHSLIIASEVVDAYQKALKLKGSHPVMFERVDDFLGTLRTPEAREQVAADSQKARNLFYFYKVEPWEQDEHYRMNLLPGPSASVRRPSLLDFTTLRAVLKDEAAPEMPAFRTLICAKEGGKEYVDKWPPFVYVEGQWRILISPSL